MESIRMLTAKLDRISQKVDNMQANQSAWSSGSYGAHGMYGYRSSESSHFNQDAAWDEVNALPARPTGNTYLNQYNPAWHNDNSSYMNAPYQSHNMQNQHLTNFPHPTANHFYQDPLHLALPPPEKSRTEELLEQLILSQQPKKSRTEELLEQLILSQQKNDLEREQKFQQLFSGLDELTDHSALLETHIDQLSAGPSQLETHEPEGQGSEKHLIETPACDFSTYTDSCFFDAVYDRFMELEKSETEELPTQFEANPREGADESIFNREGQMELEGSGTDEPVENHKPAQVSETPEPEMQQETEHQLETLTSEVYNVPTFSINTNSCFMSDTFDRFMELEHKEGCSKDLWEQPSTDEVILHEDGGPWREEKQPWGYKVRPPLHDLKIMKWWDTG